MRSNEFKRRLRNLLWPATSLMAAASHGLSGVFRRGKPAAGSAPAPDPFTELPHEGNRELFTAFKPFYSPELQVGSYNAHPDLSERLYEVEPQGKTIRANACGFPIIANPKGLVFAWAKGRDNIYIKLGEEFREAARADQGRPNAEYGKDWVRFPAWVAPSEAVLPAPSPEAAAAFRQKRLAWDERLRHWMQAAYNDSLK